MVVTSTGSILPDLRDFFLPKSFKTCDLLRTWILVLEYLKFPTCQLIFTAIQRFLKKLEGDRKFSHGFIKILRLFSGLEYLSGKWREVPYRIWWPKINIWNLLPTLVFCYQNCSDLLGEKNVLVIKQKLLKFETEGREFAKLKFMFSKKATNIDKKIPLTWRLLSNRQIDGEYLSIFVAFLGNKNFNKR